MRLNHNDSALIDNVNTQSTSKFQITANGTAFQILSSGLYSDKIMAVLRELTCNAFDSHVAVGKKNIPVTVILPTEKNLSLTVKDTGLGLDHDGVISLYTNYFSSNKRDDNSQIGGFGLGSKSPFAYTDNFTVVAVKDGMKRIYSAYLTDGTPAITLLSEDKTDDCNGVEVQLNVKQKDVQEFHVKANLLRTWFDVSPNFINLDNEQKYLVRDYVYSGTYCFIRSKTNTAFHKIERWGYPSGSVAIMGNVCYPLDANAISGGNKAIEDFLAMDIEMRIPIGAVNVAASREQLQYDNASLQYLRTTLSDEINAFNNFIKKLGTDNWSDLVKAYSFYLNTLNTSKFMNYLEAHHKDIKSNFVDSKKDLSSFAGSLGSDVSVYWYAPNTVGKKQVTNGCYLRNSSKQKCEITKVKDSAIYVVDITDGAGLIEQFRLRDTDLNRLACTVYITANKKFLTDAISHAQELSQKMGSMPIVMASEFKAELERLGKLNNNKKSKKYEYVEIDSREVDVHDISTGQTTKMKLGDVKDAYYVVKNTQSKYNAWFIGNPNDKNPESFSDSQVSVLEEFLTLFYKKVQDWKFATQFIMIRPIELKNLKLEERGWKPFYADVIEELKTTYFDDYKKVRDTYPEVRFDKPGTTTNRYYYGFNNNKWYFILAEFYNRLDSNRKQELLNALSPEWQTNVIGLSKNVIPTNARRTLREALANVASLLGTEQKFIPKTENDYEAKLIKEYSKLNILNNVCFSSELNGQPNHNKDMNFSLDTLTTMLIRALI